MPIHQVHADRVTGLPKLSDTIKDWAAPVLALAGLDLGDFRAALSFAALTWNEAAVKGDPPEVIAEYVAGLAPAAAYRLSDALVELLAQMVTRRRADHAHDRRIVVDTEVVDAGPEYRISVVSMMPDAPPLIADG